MGRHSWFTSLPLRIQLQNNRPFAIALDFLLLAKIDRSQRNVRLREFGRLLHQRFQIAARWLQLSLRQLHRSDLISHAKIPGPDFERMTE